MKRKSRRWCGYLIEPYEPTMGPLRLNDDSGRERYFSECWKVFFYTSPTETTASWRTFPTLNQCRHFICRLILEEEW